MAKNKEENDLLEPVPYDPDFNGPLQKRGCTDVLCLSVFICFVAAWAGIGLYAIVNGDPSMLLVPRDSSGRRCGRDLDVLHKPYLLFHDLTACLAPTTPFSGCQTPQVCVTHCPSEAYYGQSEEPQNFTETCVDPNNPATCPKWLLPSIPFHKRCIPDLTKVTTDMLNQIQIIENSITIDNLRKSIANIKLLSEAQEAGQNIVADLITSWWKILIGVGIALVLCLIYIILLRFLASPMVWFSIFGILLGLGAGLYFTVVKYMEAQKNYEAALNIKYDEEREYAASQAKTTRDLWLTGIVILSITLLIILLMLIFLRKRINLAIALIKEGSKAVSSVTASLIFPIIPWILQIGVIVYSIVVGVYLASSGQPLYKTRYVDTTFCQGLLNVTDDTECDPENWAQNITHIINKHLECENATCKFIRMNNDVLYPYLQAYNVFGFFWLAFFVTAFGEMVLAGIFAQWYWTFNKSKLPFFAVTSAFLRTLRYHIGTLAFGSLIIAICRIIRVMLEYLDKKLKKYDNEFTKAIMCIMKCFFYCLEKFLRFLNKNAYIMCAIHGKNFCSSAKRAFGLLLRNFIRVWVLDKVTDFLFFLSKLLLTLGAGAIAYVFFVSELLPNLIDNSGLHYGIVPVLVIMLCTYLISSIFFSVYSMAVDTLFMCFLEDCERNDGSSEKPYYMSKNLMKIFGKNNKMQ